MNSRAMLLSKSVLMLAAVWAVGGCDEEKAPAAKPTPSAKVPAPAVSAPEPKPSATASAAPAEPHKDCPEGSTGEGSFNKPCEGKGTTRLMEVTWNGKPSDTGPSFRVVNKSKLDILYGKVAVYFYDKAGKQLEVSDPNDSAAKKKPVKSCAGNIFDGPMKAGEKAVISFSCVKKDHVPEGTTAIEAEMEMVGFTDAGGKKNEFYWRNKDLAPEARPRAKK